MKATGIYLGNRTYKTAGGGFKTALDMGNNFAMRLHDYLYDYDWK